MVDIRDIPTHEVLSYEHKKLDSYKSKLVVLSNISVHLLSNVLGMMFDLSGNTVEIRLGEYDNIVQDSYKVTNDSSVIIFWEVINILENLEYRIDLLTDPEYDELLQKVKSEVSSVLTNLSDSKLVLFNKFSSGYVGSTLVGNSKLTEFVDSLNLYLLSSAPQNTHIIDIEKIFNLKSIQKSIDLRFYNTAKTLYTIEFFKYYTWFVLPYFRVIFGQTKKVLILDCDNTLWRGVVGEDGLDFIEPYKEVQYIIKSLIRQGVIVCLCSKNNEKDVLAVFEKRIDMPLRIEEISMHRINWLDKATNIEDIASSLNVGLDSIVFVDDSSFEIGLVNQKLPMVETLLLSGKKKDAVMQMLDLKALFFNYKLTAEDIQKTQMYRTEAERNEHRIKFENMDDYLASLGICLEIKLDSMEDIARIAQLTQKTNQFNLTTKRYTEIEIEKLIFSENSIIFSGKVSDKYGDSGITVVVIVNIDGDNMSHIDTFLMSCRVLGRNIEYAFFDYVMRYLVSIGCEKISSNYIRSSKNKQVADLYDKFGFSIVSSNGADVEYMMDIKNYKKKKIDYVRID